MHPKQNHQTHDCLLITSKQIIHMALDFFKCHMAKKMQNNIKKCLTNGIIHCILMKCSREPINVGSQLSWESICLTSRGSQVRALQAPLIFSVWSTKIKIWRNSSVGQSTRFIPVVSRVQISLPLLHSLDSLSRFFRFLLHTDFT